MGGETTCLICSAPTNSEKKDSHGVNFNGGKHSKISQRFLVQASRYLDIDHIPCFPAAQTIATTDDNDNTVSCCDGCSTLVETYCNIYQQWNYLHLQLDWATGEIAEVMKDSGTPKIPRNRLQKCLGMFRSKFQNKVSDRRMRCPQLILEPINPQKHSQQDNFQKVAEIKKEIPHSNSTESALKKDPFFENNSSKFNVNAGNIKSEKYTPKKNCPRINLLGIAPRTASKKNVSPKSRRCEENYPQIQLPRNQEQTSHGKNLLTCRFCERRFSSRQTLKFHEITHSGQNSYKCQYCGNGFYWKHQRTQHEKLHKVEVQLKRVVPKKHK